MKKPTFVPQGPNANNIAPRIKTGVATLRYMDDPDNEHAIHTGPNNNYKSPIQQEKTQEEIDRLWAYAKLMGRTQ